MAFTDAMGLALVVAGGVVVPAAGAVLRWLPAGGGGGAEPRPTPVPVPIRQTA